MVYQNKGEKRLYVFNKVHMETEWGEKTINIFEVLPLSTLSHCHHTLHPLTRGYV